MVNLLLKHIDHVVAWGGATYDCSYIYKPKNEVELRKVFEIARTQGLTIAFRGSGQSYGDASMNGEHVLVDLSGWNKILSWDSSTGEITVQCGVTIEQLWRKVISSGWWPPVVPGTMQPTMGGCLAMNIHGKNHWREGSFGEHVIGFTALLGNGQIVNCDKNDSSDLFHSMIGSFGMLGCFLTITLQLKKVNSDSVEVSSLSASNFDDLLMIIDQKKGCDYVVGWLDCVASDAIIGRGVVHTAMYLEAVEYENDNLITRYDLPDKLFLLPYKYIWIILRLFNHHIGYKIINMLRFYSGKLRHKHTFNQSLVQFNFLLDYIPNWKRAFMPGGLVQYQCFVPFDDAIDVFTNIINSCHQYKIIPYLGVVKRHRNDDFLISCNLDGFSMALDFSVTEKNRDGISQLMSKLDEIVIDAGGRFYFAKDSNLSPDTTRSFLKKKVIQELINKKQDCDPYNLLQTNLSRRILPELHR